MLSPGSLRLIERAFSMPALEIADRLRQYVTARGDRFWHRTRDNFSCPGQSEPYALGKFFFNDADIPALITELKRVCPSQVNDIVLRAEKICCHRFDLLGYEDLAYGPEIDWHFDAVHGRRAPLKPWFKVRYLDFNEVGDSKVIWELNRHQHLATLAKAYGITGEEKFVREILAEWTSWHEHNPYPIGVNWASSLEVAFRSLSWIWTFFFVLECPLFGPDLQRQWLNALSLNGRHIETYLSTYFSPNTHLLGEALALFFIGTLFPGCRSAKRWQRRGWEILNREALKQVRPDGFYFEQSTYYHVYALDMFMHSRVLAALNGVSIAPDFDRNLERMLNALMLLCRAGIPLSIGDDDGGRLFDPRRNRAEHMLDPLATGAVLYHRGDFKFLAGNPREETVWLLGRTGLADFDALPESEPIAASTALPESGIYLMHDVSGQQLQIDAGPLGAGSGGHGHADALSIGLIRQGRNLLLDPGTLKYVGDNGDRDVLRGTGAHNTVQVDGQDQANPAGPFSWTRFPQVRVEEWITGQQFDLFRGIHDGYRRLSSPVTHQRLVFHAKGSFWLIRDVVEGAGPHQVNILWHLGATLCPENSNPVVFSNDFASLGLLSVAGHGGTQSVTREYCSSVYGMRAGASVVTFGMQTQLPMDFVTLLVANDRGRLDLGQLVRLNEFALGTPCGYFYRNSRAEHVFVFAAHQGSWTLDGWGSDAEFLWCSSAPAGNAYNLVLCNASYVDAAGRRVLTCGEKVSYVEVVSSTGKSEVLSPNAESVVLEQALDQMWTHRDAAVPIHNPKRVGV